jgi:hypothetical protein
MAEISGIVSYVLADSKRTVRVKKWSTKKFFTVVREIASVGEKVFPFVGGGKLEDILKGLACLGAEGVPVIARIVKDSIDEPDVTIEAIEDWGLEESLGLLEKVIEVNFTEGLSKNFRGLLDGLKTRFRVLQGTASKP